jgi:hypothetical protein
MTAERRVRIHVVGLSALALALVPAAVAVGASAWLGFTITLRGFSLQISQEHRRAIYVGAPTPIADPLRFVIEKDGPMTITRADVEGRELVAYAQNTSRVPQCFSELHWALLSPTGVLIRAGAEYVEDVEAPVHHAEIVELRAEIGDDVRASALGLSVTSQECSRP